MPAPSFARRLLRWFDRHGRHDLPWQHPRTAYRVWVSEVMLQQTQVATVVPYFRRFLRRFPTLKSLAGARPDAVLAQWSGLGYYARARNLHQAARLVVAQHGGRFPRELEAVSALPGIGRSTAAAILAQAFGQRHAILDGNVKRVLARHAGIAGWPGEPAVADRLWQVAEAHLPLSRLADYTQALMDLGATVCTARDPSCAACPLRADCVGLGTGRTADLPGRKPARTRPQRNANLLLIEDGAGALLLERRPPTGIWGGLWCPPVHEGPWRRAVRARHGLEIGRARKLPVIRHGFSHYDLELQPLRLAARPAAGRVGDPAGSAWLTLDQALRRGLPAPVRTLLTSLK